MMGCFLLSIGSLVIPAPKNLPHIHSVVNCLYSCIHFIIFVIYFHHLQFDVYKSPTALTKTPTFTKTKEKRT